jgi:DNA primase
MTVEEMEDTLSRLGIDVYNVRGDEIQALCPAHLERTGKTDNNPSWYINSDTGAHICFSCGWKGNVYGLISYVTKTDYDEAGKWLGSTDGLATRFERIVREPKPIAEITTFTESMLKAFTPPPVLALQARGLTASAAEKYELLWDARQKNWIIPIRNSQTNKLIGWQEKGFDHRYFNNKPTGVKKSKSLFGYQHVDFHHGTTILVESPLDVVRLASLGFCGVAAYGAIVSHAQFNLIRSSPNLIFALDNDEAGRKSSKALLAMAKAMHVEARFFNYSETNMKDVGGMSFGEVEWGINNARHMIRGERAI